MKNPLNIKDIVFENIKYVPMRNGKGVILRYMYNNDDEKFFFQTPELVIKKIDTNNELSEIYIYLDDSSENLNLFKNFLVNLDKSVVKKARLNKDWFRTNNIKFKGLIRYDNFNLPYLKLKIKNSYLDNVNITSNKQSEKCIFSDLKNDMKVKMILDVNGLWINEKSFGIYLKPYLIDIRQSYDLILNCSSEDELLDTDILEKNPNNILLNLEENDLEIKKEILGYLSESSENKVSSLNETSTINSNSSDKLTPKELQNEIKYD